MPPLYEATEDLGIPPTPKGTILDLTEAQAAPYGKSLKLCKAVKDEPAPEATKVESTDPAADAEAAAKAAGEAAKAEEERIAAEEAAALEKAEADKAAAEASKAEMDAMSEEERKAAGEKITKEAAEKAKAEKAAAKKEAEEKAAADKAEAEKAEAEAAAAAAAVEEANKADDLTKVKGISKNRQEDLNAEGIKTYQQLIDADPVQLAMVIKGASADTVRGWQEQAKGLKG